MKRYYLTTIGICLTLLLLFSFVFGVWTAMPKKSVLRVGFLYEGDESTPYTYNLFLAQNTLKAEYGDRVEILSQSNVLASEAEEPLEELAVKGCRIIFTNIHSDEFVRLAPEYPDIEFCQISWREGDTADTPANYHTFNGKIYQGWYVSGIVAGMKLRELIDNGSIRPEEAMVGYMAAFSTPETISAFTAFFLGVRSEAPEAFMHVHYTNTWSNYTDERECAIGLIRDGCVIIAQNTATIGPAAACEDAGIPLHRKVFHIGFNQEMIDEAPTASLISTRINWTPYVMGAVGAVLASRPIERYVDGDVHGRDMSGGFERDWVEMLELNRHIAARGTEERMEQTIDAFRKNKIEVFRGDYLGVNPEDSSDTYDLNQGYVESENTSLPSFHYILKDVITTD